MVQELLGKLDNADLSVELKLALKALVREVELLQPSLSVVQKRRTQYRLARVVTEAIDPATDPHWWEVYLRSRRQGSPRVRRGRSAGRSSDPAAAPAAASAVGPL